MSVLKKLEKAFIVNFEITNQCNLDCMFCSAQLSRYARKDLPTSKVLSIIDKIAQQDIYSIFLTGGEPLLRNDLPQIIERCMNHEMNVMLSTNGIMESEEVADRIASTGLEEIQVSIHAPNEINDRLVQADGALEQSLQGLRNLVNAGLKVTVASVATRKNINLLPKLAKQVAEMGAKYFRVLRLIPHSDKMLKFLVPYEEMRKTVDEFGLLDDNLSDFTISIHASPGFVDEKFSDPDEYSIVHPLCHTCTAGKTSFGILPNGDCVPCLELKDPEFICGNILDKTIDKIWDSQPMATIRSATPDRYKGECADCNKKWLCYSARCVAHNLEGDILGDDVSCYLLRGEDRKPNLGR